MSARDTHEQRLELWPRLATLPTTNAFLALVMVLWALTGICAIAFALVTCMRDAERVALAVPDQWYGSLEVLTGIVVVQFIGKRASDTTLWQRGKKDANGPA